MYPVAHKNNPSYNNNSSGIFRFDKIEKKNNFDLPNGNIKLFLTEMNVQLLTL